MSTEHPEARGVRVVLDDDGFDDRAAGLHDALGRLSAARQTRHLRAGAPVLPAAPGDHGAPFRFAGRARAASARLESRPDDVS